jgi:hypothetical protein
LTEAGKDGDSSSNSGIANDDSDDQDFICIEEQVYPENRLEGPGP